MFTSSSVTQTALRLPSDVGGRSDDVDAATVGLFLQSSQPNTFIQRVHDTQPGDGPMKLQVPRASICSAALVLAVAAQAGGQQSPQQTEREARPKGRNLTLVGCLQVADASPSGATTASGSPAGARSNGASRQDADFILAPVTSGGSQTPTAAPRAGSKSVPVQRSYRIFGSVGEMNKLVNHRVEVTGTLDDRPSGAGAGVVSDATVNGAGTGGAPLAGTTGSGNATGPGASPGMPRLRVTSARELPGGETCAAGGRD